MDQATAEKATRIKAVRAIIGAFYALPNNGTGGCLHVVLDDGNIADQNIEGGIAEAKREGDEPAIRVGEMLLDLPEDERRLAVAWYDDPELVGLIGLVVG